MILKNISLDKIKEYNKYFNTTAFWDKLKKSAKRIGKKGVYYALLLYYMLMSKETSWYNKALIAGALGYLIFPLDFIPDALPIIGYSDDFAALMTVFKQVRKGITPKVKAQAQKKLFDWFSQEN